MEVEVALAVLVSCIGWRWRTMYEKFHACVGYGHFRYFLRTPTAYPCKNNARTTFYDMLAAFLINVARYYGVMERDMAGARKS